MSTFVLFSVLAAFVIGFLAGASFVIGQMEKQLDESRSGSAEQIR